MADQAERVGVAAGDEDYGGVVGDFAGEVLQVAVDFHRERGFGEAGADGGGDGGAGDRAVEAAARAVWQGYGGHR